MSTLGGTAAALGLAPYLTVYTFDSDARQHAFSPFATKLFFRLRHGGVPYETALGTRQEAPKGKIPYVRFHRQPDWQERQREGGSKSATMAAVKEDVVGNSAIITSRLMKEGMLQDLNAELTHTGLAWDLSLRTLVEDRLYYLLAYERWFLYYTLMRDRGPFERFSALLRRLICSFIWTFTIVMLYFQGSGRLTHDEMRRFRDEGLNALAAVIGARYAEQKTRESIEAANTRHEDAEETVGREPFWIFGHDHPTEADFTVFGYLAGVYGTRTQPETRRFVAENEALTEYIMRIHNKYFPDFKDPRVQGEPL